MPTSSIVTANVLRARSIALRERVLEPYRADPALAALRDRASMLVPGCGNMAARLMIVGEGPGDTEDRCGVPFVGPAGQLLNEFLVEAGIDRETCWVTNLLKFRATDSRGHDRRPTRDESRASAGYLRREIGIIGPRLVVLCGRAAYQAVRPGGVITQERGKVFDGKVPGRRYLPVLHPSACLQGPAEWTMLTRGDFKLIPGLLEA